MISHLQEQWSPEQIAGSVRLEGIIISYEAIYQFIWADKKAGGLLYTNLRHSGKKYKKRSGKNAGRDLIPGRLDISQRPQEVELTSRCGDWEGDTIVDSRHQGAVLTLVDRHSKLTKMAHAEPVLHQRQKVGRSSKYQILYKPESMFHVEQNQGKKKPAQRRVEKEGLGGDLLSHGKIHTIIGAKLFHD